MRFWAYCFGLLLLLVCPDLAIGQYMRMTTDNPADDTRLKGIGEITIVTITLNTDHDRDGSLQTCNSHSDACGAPATSQPLNIFSYTLAFKAVGGTVSWGTFTAADANYVTIIPQIQSDTEVEINQALPAGRVTDPGLVTLGSIAVTVLAGAPALTLQNGPGTLNPFGFGTGFGTFCDAFMFGNTYVHGDPSDPCGAGNNIVGDWFDFDGVTSGSSSAPVPTITATPNPQATEGIPMTPIQVTATDPDASNTLTITQSGMPEDLTFAADAPGPSPRHATISGTPGLTDGNPLGLPYGRYYRIVLTVSDGTEFGFASVVSTLWIYNVDRWPTLDPVANMSVDQGSTADQAITGSDPDGGGEFVTFTKVAGPGFMTVTTISPGLGNIHLAPMLGSAPTSYAATVRATSGPGPNVGTSDRTFTITVAAVATSCPASVFHDSDNGTVRLGSGKPTWSGNVQPSSGCYSNGDVVASSFVMKYAGGEIPASETSVGGDKNADGIEEVQVTFTKGDLRDLFRGTSLANGHNEVTVTLEASLSNGGALSGTTVLDLVNNGRFATATVAPNPLNPVATLTYTILRPGAVRVDLFDIQGRWMRRIVDEPFQAAGIHDATIDGRDAHGAKLPSGVYYIRGTSAEGEFKQLITILK